MQFVANVRSISAGKMDDTGDLYASIMIESDIERVDTDKRITSGSSDSKYNLVTDSDNKLAKELFKAFVFPCQVNLKVKTVTKKGIGSLVVIGYVPVPSK